MKVPAVFEPSASGSTPPALDAIPQQLKDAAQWVAWREEQRDGELTKPPINAHTGQHAKTNDPDTWGTLQEALERVERDQLLGVGYVLTLEDGIVAVDLDDCRDPRTGALTPMAQRIVERFNSYTEISPSGRGLHIFVLGKLPPGARRIDGVEMYASGRYFTVTGNRLESVSAALEERQEAIEALHRWISADAELVTEVQAQDPRFAALWDGDTSQYDGDQSRADQALCNMLAPRCNRDPQRMDRIFRWSGLMRPKWDEPRGQQTYGERTIATALEGSNASKEQYSETQNAGGSKCLRVLSAEEFMNREFEVKEPLIEGLLHRRDLVALAGRRREGKTTLAINMGVALALPVKEFLGYPIPEARRSLLLLLEDDPRELQEKLRRVTGGRSTEGRLRIVTRDDFYEAEIQIDIRNKDFCEAIRNSAREHKPDLIVIDNLAHVIAAEYNDAKRVHELMTFCYQLAKENNCGIVLCAHPRKEDMDHPISLEYNPAGFFDSVMGSSHFVNSTGSLWGIQRPSGEDFSVFLGGRQRADGYQAAARIWMDDNGWLQVADDYKQNLRLVTNTEARRNAWERLPEPPKTFGYREAERMVKPVMRSSSTFTNWVKECRRLRMIVDTSDGRLMKRGGPENVEAPEAEEAA